MKILNITKETYFPQEIRLPLLTMDGTDTVVILGPGDFVFTEENGNNSILRLYETKKIIKVLDEEKSEKLEFYVVYNEEGKLTSKIVEENTANIVSTEIEDVKKTLKEDVLDTAITIEVVVPEESVKNKGGRPKGVTNKKKQGRPKSKKRVSKKVSKKSSKKTPKK